MERMLEKSIIEFMHMISEMNQVKRCIVTEEFLYETGTIVVRSK